MPSNLQEIKEEIIKRKEKAFKNYLKRLENKETLKSTSVLEKYEYEQNEFKVKTGTLLDELVGGGVPEGKSMSFMVNLGLQKLKLALHQQFYVQIMLFILIQKEVLEPLE